MILDIRGTNGAGKSFIVHSLLNSYGKQVLRDGQKVLGHYAPKLDLAVVGTYMTQCGGCDSIKTANGIEQRVREYAAKYPRVIFEGITVAHTYQRYNDLALDLEEQGHEYYFLFLTTPVELCIKRVIQRRKAKGNNKPFDPYKHMGLVSDYGRVLSAYNKLKAAGRKIIDLNHTKPLAQVLEILNAHRSK